MDAVNNDVSSSFIPAMETDNINSKIKSVMKAAYTVRSPDNPSIAAILGGHPDRQPVHLAPDWPQLQY